MNNQITKQSITRNHEMTSRIEDNVSSYIRKLLLSKYHTMKAYTHWGGCWVGPRSGLHAMARKKYPAPVGNLTAVKQ